MKIRTGQDSIERTEEQILSSCNKIALHNSEEVLDFAWMQ